MNGSTVLSSIAKRAAVATKGAERRDVSPKCWNGGRGGSAASGVSATVQVHSRSFTCDSFHSSLLRRGATEPPDSHSPPLHVLHVLHGHPLCASASLRLCVNNLPSPSTRSTCSTRQTSLRTLRPCVSALKILIPLYTFYMFYTAKILCTLCALCVSASLR